MNVCMVCYFPVNVASMSKEYVLSFISPLGSNFHKCPTPLSSHTKTW
ncbi:unnamed protein product, partial [Vitis vinifera]